MSFLTSANRMVTNYTKFLLTIRIIYLVVKLLIGLTFGIFWVVIKFIALLPKIVGENGLKKITRSSFDIVDRAEHQSEKIDDLEKEVTNLRIQLANKRDKKE